MTVAGDGDSGEVGLGPGDAEEVGYDGCHLGGHAWEALWIELEEK